MVVNTDAVRHRVVSTTMTMGLAMEKRVRRNLCPETILMVSVCTNDDGTATRFEIGQPGASAILSERTFQRLPPNALRIAESSGLQVIRRRCPPNSRF